MRALVTGSAGHLGEGLMRALLECGSDAVGLDLLASPYTTHTGSVCDAHFVHRCLRGVDVVFHAATLHKPHIATHSRSAFVDTNVTGTLNVLEAALVCGVSAVVFTSTTSVFGRALTPAAGAPAAWITEAVEPIAKNIYGVTKRAAEDLCELFYRSKGLPTLVLRTSRFFPEEDDDEALRRGFDDLNLKVNEVLYRRVDLADAVEAHLLAAERAAAIGFAKYIISATTPFTFDQCSLLGTDAARVVKELFPDYEEEYRRRKWTMLETLDRVYLNERARQELDWRPRLDFRSVLDRLERGDDPFSRLAQEVGSKGYHRQTFQRGPYPVESVD